MANSQYEDPFLKILPSLDLHGETGEFVPMLVRDFINVNYKMGKDKVLIIHGRHGGVLKSAVHEYLKSDSRVSRYYIYNMNDGVTIAELKPLVKFL